jgi:hypothetical protein
MSYQQDQLAILGGACVARGLAGGAQLVEARRSLAKRPDDHCQKPIAPRVLSAFNSEMSF